MIELRGEMNEWKESTMMMIESVLDNERNQLPEDKNITHFGGGYVECLKTKAKLVLYFGFDESRNRCQIILDIDKEDVLLWQQAIAERIWNRTKNTPKYSFANGKDTKKVKIKAPEIDPDLLWSGAEDEG
jgi:hypothetical protein